MVESATHLRCVERMQFVHEPYAGVELRVWRDSFLQARHSDQHGSLVIKGNLILRTLAMPADTNPNGDVFGVGSCRTC